MIESKLELDEVRLELCVLPYLLVRRCTFPVGWLRNLGHKEVERILLELLDNIEGSRVASEAVVSHLTAAVPTLSGPLRSKALDLKRHVLRRAYLIPEKYSALIETQGDAFRAILNSWINSGLKQEETNQKLKTTLSLELGKARINLHRALGEPRVKEAVFLSGEAFFGALERYLKTEKDGSGNEVTLFEEKAAKLIARGASKTTALHVLSGTAVGNWAELPDSISVDIPSEAQFDPFIKRRVQLILPIVRALATKAMDFPNTWKHVVPRVSPGLALEKDRIRFNKYDAGQMAVFALPRNEVIDLFIEKAHPRTLTAVSLVEEVCRSLKDEYSLESVTKLYSQLCKKGVLLGHFEIPFEHPDPLECLLDWLQTLPKQDVPRNFLNEIKEIRKELDRGENPEISWEERLSTYSKIGEYARRILPNATFEAVRDMIIVETMPGPAEIRINKTILGDLNSAFLACYCLSAATGIIDKPEESLAKLLDGLDIPGHEPGSEYIPLNAISEATERTDRPQREPSVMEEPLTQLISNAIEAKRNATGWVHSLDLRQDGILSKISHFGRSYFNQGMAGVEFQVANCRGEKPQVVINDIKASPISQFARYSRLYSRPEYDESLKQFMKSLKRHFYPEKVWTDVIAQPNEKGETFTWFRSLQEHSIEVDEARSGRDIKHVIPLNELWIKRDGAHAELMWRRKGKDSPVHPYFCSLRSHALDTPIMKIYRTLGFGAGVPLDVWKLVLLSKLKHIPRITLDNVVLFRETWVFEKQEAIENVDSDIFSSFEKWNLWRLSKHMPQFVYFRQMKSPLYVDFLSLYSIANLNSALAKDVKVSCRFTEVLPSIDKDAEESRTTQYTAGLLWQKPRS